MTNLLWIAFWLTILASARDGEPLPDLKFGQWILIDVALDCR